MSDVKDEVLTLKGFLPNAEMKRIWRSLAESQLVPCPYCERLHTHGKLPGVRSAHCPSNRPGGYDLVIAGEITPEEFIELQANANQAGYRKSGNYTDKQAEVLARKDAADMRRFLRRRRKEIAERDEFVANIRRRRNLH